MRWTCCFSQKQTEELCKGQMYFWNYELLFAAIIMDLDQFYFDFTYIIIILVVRTIFRNIQLCVECEKLYAISSQLVTDQDIR